MEHPENNEEYKGLVVNKGIEQPSSVNPYLKRKPKKRQLSVAEFVEGIVKGDVTILSQAVTLVESVKPEHQAVAQEVIEKCLPYSGNSIRVGISGVPGAGKSTSIDVFGLHVLEKGGKLAVLAIDPSSERSKGSILGDKTRMEQLSVHPKSFIRPSPSAGSLGGVARKTRETIVLCEAAGFDKIFVETVGVGQSETAVHSMVDFFSWQVREMNCKASNEESWRWRTVLSSTKPTEIIWNLPSWLPVSSVMRCICFRLPNRDGFRRC